ncbi:MAG TPA: hypothetical protein VJA19_08390 [Pseudomonas sp.]|nr:hypothetical protein [Pseudomonas sp.]
MEYNTMKSPLQTLPTLMLIIVASVSSAQAESGSEQLAKFRLKQDTLAAQLTEWNMEQRLAQIIEAQPTASGPVSKQQAAPPATKAPAHYPRPLHRSQK